MEYTLEIQAFNIVLLSIDSLLEIIRLTTCICKNICFSEIIHLLSKKFSIEFVAKMKNTTKVPNVRKKIDYIKYINYLSCKKQIDITNKIISEIPKWYFTETIDPKVLTVEFYEYSKNGRTIFNYYEMFSYYNIDLVLCLCLLDRAFELDVADEKLIHHFMFAASGNENWDMQHHLEDSIVLFKYLIKKERYEEIISCNYGLPDHFYYEDDEDEGLYEENREIMFKLCSELFELDEKALRLSEMKQVD